MDDSLRCSFCQKSQGVVGKLISSPSDRERAYICDECIAVCQAIIEDDRAEKNAAAGAKPSGPLELGEYLDQYVPGASLLLEKIAKREGIAVTDEVDREIDLIPSGDPVVTGARLGNEEAFAQIALQIRTEKALQYLFNWAEKQV